MGKSGKFVRIGTDHLPFIFRERRMGGAPERWLTVARSARTTREDLGEGAEMASGDRLSGRRRTMWRHSRKNTDRSSWSKVLRSTP
jgi:hypothetical protein